MVLVIETTSGLTFILSVVFEIGHVHTKMENKGDHSHRSKLSFGKEERKNKMQGFKAKV